MKVLILNGSHRKNGNCDLFCKTIYEFIMQRHSVIAYNVADQFIRRCNGCLVCEENEACPLVDDYSMHIRQSFIDSDIILFATPTYFNMPSSAMVNLIDRTNDLCDYFAENSKKVITFISGQTDDESLNDTYRCLKTYYDIMGFSEILPPILHVARFQTPVDSDVIGSIENALGQRN